MIIYLYLSILIAVSIVTGIITTIVERKGLYPKPEKKVKQVKVKKEKKLPVVAEPVYEEEPILTPIPEDENYDIPVLISSYTVDLSGVVNQIQKIDVKEEEIERLSETSTNIMNVGDFVCK